MRSIHSWLTLVCLLALLVTACGSAGDPSDQEKPPDLHSPVTTERTALLRPSEQAAEVPTPTGTSSPSYSVALGPIAQFGGPIINAIEYSPDGSTIAVATTLGIRLHDAADLSVLSEITTQASVVAIAYSPGGSLLAWVPSAPPSVVIWNPAEGSEERILETDELPFCVTFSSDGLLVAAGTGQHVLVWDSETGNLVHRLPLPETQGYARVTDVEFSPTGGILASASSQGSYQLWSLPEGVLIREHALEPGGSGSYFSYVGVAFPPDGELIVSLKGYDLQSWRLQDGAAVATVDTLNGRSLAMSSDGRSVAVGNDHGVMNIHTGPYWSESHRVTVTPYNAVNPNPEIRVMADFSPGGELVAVANASGRLEVRRTEDGAVVVAEPGLDNRAVVDVAISSGEGLVAAMLDQGAANVWDAAARLPIRTMYFDPDQSYWLGASSLAFGGNGTLAIAALESGAEVWSTEGWVRFAVTDRCTEAKGSCKTVTSVALSEAGTHLAVGINMPRYNPSDDAGEVRVWRLQDGRLLGHLSTATVVNDLAFLPGDERLLVAMGDGEVRLVRVDGMETLAMSRVEVIDPYVHAPRQVGVQVSDGGMLFASSSEDSAWTISVWSVETGGFARQLAVELDTNLPAPPTSLALSPDGRLLAVGTYGGSVLLWGVSDGALVSQSDHAHNLAITALEFTANGERLLSGSADGTVRLWRVEDRD